ncbi:alpha/beta fold hydrolase [Lentibacillus juripiscarius]|uniref:Alpha/beta fold hydrolase n=1 Tax=Lentibacillus juripiscarius TaxID=257446 RepID=A0ABW5VCP7_9BACI
MVLLKSFEKPLNNMIEKNEKGTITKEYLEINGLRQGVIMESLNQGKPLLLFLHGGPGFPIYPIIKAHGTRLEQFFDVCYWDQRGAGMSYHDKETDKPLTVEQLVDDTIQVVNYLREKHSQEKVFLLGHSWGTYLGSLVANKKPELFHAYIGVGQVGAAKESENETYNFILKTAINQNDKRAAKKIEKVIFDENYYKNRTYGAVRAKYTNKYGVGFKRDGYSSFENLRHVFSCPNYTLKERMNIIRGSFSSYQWLGHVMATTDLVELVPTLNLPVFILQGQHDYQTTHTQAKRFYESITAPHKKMFTFENSSHTPFIEEPERFYEIMQDEVLGIM